MNSCWSDMFSSMRTRRRDTTLYSLGMFATASPIDFSPRSILHVLFPRTTGLSSQSHDLARADPFRPSAHVSSSPPNTRQSGNRYLSAASWRERQSETLGEYIDLVVQE